MKKISELKAQIRRCFALARELGKPWDEYYPRIKNAINATCIQHYGFRAHSRELSNYVKKHPEIC